MKIKEIAFSDSVYGFSSYNDKTLNDFISYLNEIADKKCPAEYRNDIMFSLQVDESYGDPTPEIELFYFRDDTEHERNLRLAQEAAIEDIKIKQAKLILQKHGVKFE